MRAAPARRAQRHRVSASLDVGSVGATPPQCVLPAARAGHRDNPKVIQRGREIMPPRGRRVSQPNGNRNAAGHVARYKPTGALCRVVC